jgi:glycosyltransferase involved in cell wall biosynthesis
MRDEYEHSLVSVIIPTYNRAHMVTEAMDSVWAQNYRPIETIVVDDGSSDNTAEAVEQWRISHSEDLQFSVRYYYQENAGAPAARNLGIVESNGEFIQFLDSDDLLGQTKIHTQVRFLNQHGGLVSAFGKWRYFIQNSGSVIVSAPEPQLTEHFAQYDCSLEENDLLVKWISGEFIPPHSILWKRRAVCSIGPWDEGAFANDDGEFACRFLIMGGCFRFCPGSWVYYRRGCDDHYSSLNTRTAAQSRFYAAEKIGSALIDRNMLGNRLQMAMVKQYFRIARSAAGTDNDIAAKCFTRIYQLKSDRPIRIRNLIHVSKGLAYVTAIGMSLLRAWRRLVQKRTFKVKFHTDSVHKLITHETVDK